MPLSGPSINKIGELNGWATMLCSATGDWKWILRLPNGWTAMVIDDTVSRSVNKSHGHIKYRIATQAARRYVAGTYLYSTLQEAKRAALRLALDQDETT